MTKHEDKVDLDPAKVEQEPVIASAKDDEPTALAFDELEERIAPITIRKAGGGGSGGVGY